ncbi:MAG TPA: DUF1552 domain-containing protein [Verrucomicrobiales bacterium]|nr:DUF1552 domain-containing protein [Verrucomicrobiales bacterium]
MRIPDRRTFLREFGLSAAALPFVAGLPGLARGAQGAPSRQRLIIVFSPNGIVPPVFWPDETGEEFTLKPILEPLSPFRERLLILRGVANKVRGDGDSHMRGMSCLLTGKELFPGNIQGGSDTPAGWCSGISIDQELRNYYQERSETRARFGSLEFGVCVPKRADPWTRMVYAGPNQPVAPVDDPYLMFEKLYGQMKDRESLRSILDEVVEDLRRVRARIGTEDRRLLEEHETFVREMEMELAEGGNRTWDVPPPQLEDNVANDNDSMPALAKMQIDLLVNALRNDMSRIATFQFTNSVGGARMRWLGIEEGHHALSHDPDLNAESQEKLTKINVWFCEQVAALAGRLAATPEPGGEGSMLDHSLIVWTNELGKGNSHTLQDIPFVLLGNGFGFRMGRSLAFEQVAHNRLWLAIAHAAGHAIETFGNPGLCEGGALDLVSA